MSGWKDKDKVVTTFGSLQLGLGQAHEAGTATEQKRIINLLLDLNVIRRCAATNKLVGVTTDMEQVVYLTGLEND
jgi:hypothetical protein